MKKLYRYLVTVKGWGKGFKVLVQTTQHFQAPNGWRDKADIYQLLPEWVRDIGAIVKVETDVVDLVVIVED